MKLRACWLRSKMKSHVVSVIFLLVGIAIPSISRNVSLDKQQPPQRAKPYEARVFALLLAEDEFLRAQPTEAFDIYYWSLKIAEERVNELYSNLDIKVKIKRSPIRCDSSAAPVYAAEEYYTRGLSALLGPSCTKALEVSVANLTCAIIVEIIIQDRYFHICCLRHVTTA